mgnify:CR=1 FL=1
MDVSGVPFALSWVIATMLTRTTINATNWVGRCRVRRSIAAWIVPRPAFGEGSSSSVYRNVFGCTRGASGSAVELRFARPSTGRSLRNPDGGSAASGLFVGASLHGPDSI